MLDFRQPSDIFITCNKRLAPYVAQEIEQLGYTGLSTQATGVRLLGTLTDCIWLNLNLRCASQVLFSLKKFICRGPDDLYRQVSRLPWETYIPEAGYLSVTSTVYHPSIRTDMFANVRIKDAIVDRIRQKTGQRPDAGNDLSGTVVYLFWKDEQAELFIDTSGDTLAKHGYRKIPGKAPMLEALAAATLLAAGWQPRMTFVNPMCGSGTLAIEAAMLATRRVPGLFRENYAFMHLQGYQPRPYKDALARIRMQVTEVPGLQIVATDISRDAVEIAKVNAELAGVADLISWHICDFADTIIPEGEGVVFFNPEYGERLGDVEELAETYGRIGDFMKQKCQGYMGYIFTGNMELAKYIGLKAKRRTEFYNGKIDCRLLSYELYGGTKRVDALQSRKSPVT